MFDFAVFESLFLRLSPLFLFLLAGFIAARYLHVAREGLARLVIYMLSPIVFFELLIRNPFDPTLFIMPFLYAALCSIVAVTIYFISPIAFKSPMRNLISYASASANTGYFGIPATIVLLGEEKLSRAVFIIVGYNIYEYSTGFYLAARGNMQRRHALKRMAKLPTIWVLLLSFIFSSMGWNHIPQNIVPVLTAFRGAYTTIGLLIIGMGLGTIRTFKLNYNFTAWCFFVKLFFFPAVVAAYIWVDARYIHLLTEDLRQILLLMSLVPMGGNTVAIATELKLPTDEVSLTVTLTTLASLLWIPFSWSSWGHWLIESLH